MGFVALLLAAGAVAGTVYQLAAAHLVRRFARAPRPRPAEKPAISILKPLAGDEPGLAANLASLCRQDYPQFQVVCGALDPADSALGVARQVAEDFSAADFAVVAGFPLPGRNRKVANLLSMLPQARHGVVAIADSDIYADGHYLDDLAAALERPGVGLVTCLYVGRPGEGLWSRLEALGVNHGFLPSTLVARALGRNDGCFGATMALRRSVLDRIGGLEPLRDLLADDWALGSAVRRSGLKIALAARWVDMVVQQSSLAALFAHEVRWGRTVAAVDRPAYIASVITQPLALSALAALCAGGSWPFLALAGIAAACRLLAIRVQEKALDLPRAPVGLLLVREILTFAVYLAACHGRKVHWRGHDYVIRRDGTLEAVGSSSP